MTPARAAASLTSFTPPDRLTSWSAGVLRDGRLIAFSSEERPRCLGARADRPHVVKPPRQPQGGRRMPPTEGIITCEHRERREADPCGFQAFYSLVTHGGSARIRGTGERVWLAIEVTPEHVRRMHTEPMIFLETLQLLSVVAPGVELDLGYTAELPPDER